MARLIFSLCLLSFLLCTACKKEGTLKIVNNSSNPYALTINGDTYPNIQGGTTKDYCLEDGLYQVRAEQVSGFVLFPTVVNAEHDIKKGEEIIWQIP